MDSDKLKEYISLSKKVENLESGILTEIVYHLITHHNRPDLCTLREMERKLGIPYSPLRRLVTKLVEEGIVVEGMVGNSKPYRVLDIDLAFRKGYTPDVLTIEELLNIHDSATPNSVAIYGSVKGEEIYKSLPYSPLNLKTRGRVNQILEYMRVIPEMPFEEKVLSQYSDKIPLEELEHRRQLYNQLRTKLDEDWDERVEFNKLLDQWGLFHQRTGGMHVLYIPFMRSVMVEEANEKLPEHLLGEYMRNLELPRGAFTPLRHYPHISPWSIYYRDLLFELDFTDLDTLNDDEIRRALRTVAGRHLKFLLHNIQPLLDSLSEKGLDGTLTAFNESQPPDRKYTPHHILSETVPLGFSSLFVYTIKGDMELAEKGRVITRMIEAAVVNGYRGKQKEGVSLKDFSESKVSPSGLQ